MKYAVIDIGSNSVRYLEEDKKRKLTVTTRLGDGLAATGIINGERLKKSVSVIAAFADNARHAGYTPVAYATSAVRDCRNREEALDAVYKASGLTPEVLSEEDEASCAFAGAVQDENGLIDIGGASAEIAARGFTKSFPIGCVRGRDIAFIMTGAKSCDENWPLQRRALTDYMNAHFDIPMPALSPCVGVGGSITTLAALNLRLSGFEAASVHGSELTRKALEEEISYLLSLGEKRREHPLLKARHDIILYGAAVLAYFMDASSLDKLRVSLKDGMEGYIMKLRAAERKSGGEIL